MRCELGFCMICDKKIMQGCPACGMNKKPTNDYTEVQVTWSNGAAMKIGVCTACATSHAWTTPAAKEGITKAHWDAWDKLGGKYDREVVVA